LIVADCPFDNPNNSTPRVSCQPHNALIFIYFSFIFSTGYAIVIPSAANKPALTRGVFKNCIRVIFMPTTKVKPPIVPRGTLRENRSPHC